MEIAIIEAIGFERTGRIFHTYVNPETPMGRIAKEITGITDEFLKTKPLFRYVAQAFINFMQAALNL